MAKLSISDEELQLKKRARRRLVGAVALVTLVVVFLPMVLDDEPKPLDEDIAIKIPSPEADDFVPKVLPRTVVPPVPAAVVSAPVPVSAVVAAPLHASSVSAAPAAPPEIKPKTAAVKAIVAAPRIDKAKQPVQSKEAYVVQVGTFANAANAKQAHKKIVDAGIKSYTETIKTPQGDKIRVRAGPFATHEAAQKAQEKLKTIGLDGPIAPKPVK